MVPIPKGRIGNIKKSAAPIPDAYDFDESAFYDDILESVPTVTNTKPVASPAADPFDFDGAASNATPGLFDDPYGEDYVPYQPSARSLIAQPQVEVTPASVIPRADNSLLGKVKGFIGQYQQPQQEQLSLALEEKRSRLGQLWDEARRGFDNTITQGKPFLKPTPEATQGLPLEQRAGYAVGALAGDVATDSSRGFVWRWNHPLAMSGGIGNKAGELAGLSPTGVALMGYSATALMDATTGNVNWGNLEESGRPAGYQAIYANPEDPTQTTRPAEEFLTRYFVGRTGKMMPWEQFHAERPDVTPEEYIAHKKYQQSEGTLGVLKGTWNGIDGPEAQFMGYRVPLSAALQTGGALAGAVAASKAPQGTGRIATIGKSGRMLAGGMAGLAAGKLLGSLVD